MPRQLVDEIFTDEDRDFDPKVEDLGEMSLETKCKIWSLHVDYFSSYESLNGALTSSKLQIQNLSGWEGCLH